MLIDIQNIIQDVYILVLPISTVLSLQMSTRRKIAVVFVIGFGASAVLVACFRLMPLFELNSSSDFPYVLGKMVITAAIEIQLAIIAVNLPSLKALWTTMAGESSAASKGEHRRGGSYKMSTFDSHRKKRMNRISRGRITKLEHNGQRTESQEELFTHTGCSYISGKPDTGIILTREVAVETSSQTK